MSTTPDPHSADVPSGGDVPVEPVTTEAFGSEIPPTEPLGAEGLGAAGAAAGPQQSAPGAGAGSEHGHTKGDREADLRPLYAVAGLTDLVVGAVRSTLVDSQKWASARLAEMRFRQAELEKQAAELRERAEEVPDQVRTLPEVTRSRVGELQQQASSTYSELAGRGQRVVQGVAGRVDPVFDRVQEGLNAARRRVTGRAGAGAAPAAGPTDIIVVDETLDADDDLVSSPSGVPDEALVAEDTLLADGQGSAGTEDAYGSGSSTDDDGSATSQR